MVWFKTAQIPRRGICELVTSFMQYEARRRAATKNTSPTLHLSGRSVCVEFANTSAQGLSAYVHSSTGP